MSANCPVCGQGHIVREARQDQFDYQGVTLTAKSIEEFCDDCGTLLMPPELIRDNVRAKQRAKKQHDRLLSGQEIKQIRTRLGITQAEASRLFGGGANAFAKYEADDVMQSAAMDKLIRLADALPAAASWLASLSKVSLSASSIKSMTTYLYPSIRPDLFGHDGDQETTTTSMSLSEAACNDEWFADAA